MRIVNWNIQRHSPSTWKAGSLVHEIAQQHPDVICLTEAWESSLSSLNGFTIAARGVSWGGERNGERKVVLWSRTAWSDATPLKELNGIGAGITGVLSFNALRVRVVGVCIPYHLANPVGLSPRPKMWEQHTKFLDRLAPLIENWLKDGPLVVVGDFNRKVPRGWGAKAPYVTLLNSFRDLNIVTEGTLKGVDQRTIDHVAVSQEIKCQEKFGLSAFTRDGRERSDHFGVVVDLNLPASKISNHQAADRSSEVK